MTFGAAASSRRRTRVHAVAVQDGRWSRRPATRASSRSCARRPSRSRRCRSCGRATTSRRGDRDRLGVAPRLAGAARRGAQPAREGSGRGGRARVRAGADAARAQLLGQARRDARALPGEGLGERRLPARDAPGPARRACPRSQRRRTSTPTRLPTAVDGCGVLTFALPLERMALDVRAARAARGRRRAWPPRCALTPS